MVLHLAIKICKIRSLDWKSHWKDKPALYVTIRYENSGQEHQDRTEAKPGYGARWNKEFIVPTIEEDQIIRFRLKEYMRLFPKDPVVGEVEMKVKDLRSLEEIQIHKKGDSTHTCMGRIVLEVEEIDSKTAAGRTAQDARDVIEKMENKRGQANTLAERILVMIGRLDSLGPIISSINKLAEVNSYLRSAWHICTSVYKAIEKQGAEDAKVTRLVDTINKTLEFVDDAKKIKQLKDDPLPLKPIISDLFIQTAECAIFIRQYFNREFIIQIASTDREKKIDEFVDTFTALQHQLEQRIHVMNGFVSSHILGLVKEIAEINMSNLLRPSEMVTFSLPLCHHDTKKDVLQEITAWVMDDKSDQNVLWLYGLAGSGKSAIAATISKQLGPLKRRGAFLFFKRERSDQDPNAVLRTIADQLAKTNPILRAEISDILHLHSDVVNADIGDQFKKLIQGPLEVASHAMCGPIAIIIDGLDEYGDQWTRKSLISIISEKFTLLPKCFRFIITSRQEFDIDAAFSRNNRIKNLPLEARDSIPDIRIYLACEMAYTRDTPNTLEDWRWEWYLDRLAVMSEGIFIWATTLVRFVGEHPHPATCLAGILDGKKSIRDLDSLYDTILETAINIKHWDDKLSEHFRMVTALILFLGSPPSHTAIDNYLGTSKGEDSCCKILERLRSVFDYDPNCPIRPLHASFGDYLTDSSRSGDKPWTLSGYNSQGHVIACFLHLMSRQLHFNMSNLQTSHFFQESEIQSKEDEGMEESASTVGSARSESHSEPVTHPEVVQEKVHSESEETDLEPEPGTDSEANIDISWELEYASLHLIDHLMKVQVIDNDLKKELKSFLKEKLLFWLEVLCLYEKLDIIDVFYTKFRAPSIMDFEFLSLINEARHIAYNVKKLIDGNPTHIYISAFLLAPPTPSLSSVYASRLTNRILILESTVPLEGTEMMNIWTSSEMLPVHTISCEDDGLTLILGSSHDLYWRRLRIQYDGSTRDEGSDWMPQFVDDAGERDVTEVSSDFKKAVHGSKDSKLVIHPMWMGQSTNLKIPVPRSPDIDAKKALDRITFHPSNGNILAFHDSDQHHCVIVDIAQEVDPFFISTDEGYVTGRLTWSPDGLRFSFCTKGTRIHLWKFDPVTHTAKCESTFDVDIKEPSSHWQSSVKEICFHPTDESLILVITDKSVSLFRRQPNGLEYEIVHVYHDIFRNDYHYATYDPRSMDAVFSPDGSLVATYDRDYRGFEVIIFETQTARRYQDPILLPSAASRVAFRPNGEHIAIVCGDQEFQNHRPLLGSSHERLYLCRVGRGLRASSDERFKQANMRGHFHKVTSIQFSPDGSKFLTASKDGTVLVRRTQDCSLLRDYWPLEYTSPVTSAAWGTDGSTVYAALKDFTIHSSSGNVICFTVSSEIDREHKAIDKMQPLLQEGQECIALLMGHHVIVVSLEGRIIHAPLEAGWYLDKPIRFSFSENGLVARAERLSSYIHLCDLGVEGPSERLETSSKSVVLVVLSRDGSQLISLVELDEDRDNPKFECHVWDVESRALVQVLDPPPFNDKSSSWGLVLALSRDNQSLVLIDNNYLHYTIHIWHRVPGKETYSYQRSHSIHARGFDHSIDISPDGRRLVVSEYWTPGSAIMFDLDMLQRDDNYIPSSGQNDDHPDHDHMLSSTMPINWRLEEGGGWIKGPEGEYLFSFQKRTWEALDPPGSAYVIRRRRQRIDFTKLKHGEYWEECYQPPSGRHSITQN